MKVRGEKAGMNIEQNDKCTSNPDGTPTGYDRRINPNTKVRMRKYPNVAGVVDGWVGHSLVRVAWEPGIRADVFASELEVIPCTPEATNDPHPHPEEVIRCPTCTCDKVERCIRDKCPRCCYCTAAIGHGQEPRSSEADANGQLYRMDPGGKLTAVDENLVPLDAPRTNDARARIERTTASESEVQAAIREAVTSGNGLDIYAGGLLTMQIAARAPIRDLDDELRSQEATLEERGLTYGCVACADPISAYGMCSRCSNAYGMGMTEERKKWIHGKRTDKAQCTPTTDFGCEARVKLAKARGALETVRQELIEVGYARSLDEDLIEVVTVALDESAQPQPCARPLDYVQATGERGENVVLSDGREGTIEASWSHHRTVPDRECSIVLSRDERGDPTKTTRALLSTLRSKGES